MLMTSHPIDPNQRDSARVENRGPCTTTIVPPSCTARPSSAAAATSTARSLGVVGLGERHVVHLGPVEERVGAARRAVDQLVHHHEVARMDVGLQRARGARRDDRSHPELAHRPHVGPVVDAVRRQLVVGGRAEAGTRPGGRRQIRCDRARRERRTECRHRPCRRRRGTSRSRTRRRRRRRLGSRVSRWRTYCSTRWSRSTTTTSEVDDASSWLWSTPAAVAVRVPVVAPPDVVSTCSTHCSNELDSEPLDDELLRLPFDRLSFL